MKKFVLILMSVFPFVASAQFDDIYFVPEKEKKVVVASSAKDNAFVDIDNYDQYLEEEIYDTYNVDDQYEYYDDDDFRYSTRIIRFRSPGTLLGSNLYWDLRYNCGINDWLVYDNGYYLDIYPTYNNYYYWSYTPYNSYWSWNTWHNPYCHWNDYYWGYNYHYPSYHWSGHHHYYHHHGGYHPPYFAHNSWRPKHKVQTNIPVNRGNGRPLVTSNPRRERPTGTTVNRGGNTSVARPAGQPTNRVVGNGQARPANTVNSSRPAVVKRQPVEQTTVNRAPSRQGSTATQSVNRQPTTRPSGTPVRSTTNVGAGQQRGSAVNVRPSQQRPSAPQPVRSSVSRSGSNSSSSREYNRPSSTSVTRQRSSSSSVSRPSSSSSSSRSSSVSRPSSSSSSSRSSSVSRPSSSSSGSNYTRSSSSSGSRPSSSSSGSRGGSYRR